MAQIIIKNNVCTIDDETDIEFLRRLDKELSFKVQGAEYTWAFKQGQWDGIHNILTPDLKFPYGLINRVKDCYSNNNKHCEVIDKRLDKSPISSINIKKNLIAVNRNPYPYQLDALESVKNNDCGIIRIGTGGGKTVVAALMCAHFGKRTIIYVVGKDLLYQTHGFLQKVFDEEIGIVGDGKCEIHDINVVSVWTIGQALGMEKSKILLDNDDKESSISKEKYKDILDLMRTAQVHIFDECHLCSADTFQEIARKINPEHLYGMSATPFHDSGCDLLIESIFGSKIVDISSSFLIKNKYLAKPLIKFKKVDAQKFAASDPYQTIYKNYITDNPIRNNLIVTGAEYLISQGYQTLVLFSKLNHGKTLYDELSKRTSCLLLSGKDSAKTRDLAKKKLENREINCLVASTIFDIGVDMPSLSGLVIASGGKSSVRASQRVGRVIRKYPNKEYAAIIDFYDQARILKSHSISRYKIYSSEEEFNVTWPK